MCLCVFMRVCVLGAPCATFRKEGNARYLFVLCLPSDQTLFARLSSMAVIVVFVVAVVGQEE